MQVALAWLAGRGRSFACGWEVAGSNLTLGGRGLLGFLGCREDEGQAARPVPRAPPRTVTRDRRAAADRTATPVNESGKVRLR